MKIRAVALGEVDLQVRPHVRAPAQQAEQRALGLIVVAHRRVLRYHWRSQGQALRYDPDAQAKRDRPGIFFDGAPGDGERSSRTRVVRVALVAHLQDPRQVRVPK
ncbi:MAG: hypothetical protein AMXMBFR64_60140 [Myxococcales bacterium]